MAAKTTRKRKASSTRRVHVTLPAEAYQRLSARAALEYRTPHQQLQLLIDTAMVDQGYQTPDRSGNVIDPPGIQVEDTPDGPTDLIDGPVGLNDDE